MKRVVVASGLVVVAVAIIAACADLSGLTGGGDASTLVDAGADGSFESPLDADAPDSDVDPNGNDAEAGLVDVFVVDATACCDCDKDTFTTDAGDASCAPTLRDCDDAVEAIRPNAGFVANAVWPSSTYTLSFDWNCDGVVTKQLPHNFVCGGTAAGGCSGEGFLDNPPCGVAANYYKCVAQALNCQPQPDSLRTQACK